MAKKITINYLPRNWAKLLHDCKKRWMVLVLHRRAGKTTAVLNHLQRSALMKAKTKYAYIAPTYKQAKLIAWDIIKEYARCIPNIKYNESELKVIYPNGSTLTLFGSENIDALRGIALWGCGLDENSQQPSSLFGEVISKCLADNLGYCIWLGTPKGKNQFHKTYTNAQKNEDWLAILRTIDDSVEKEEGEVIDNLKIALEDDKKLVAQGEMTQEEVDQEWYCSFEASIKGAYYVRQIATLREDGRYKLIPYDEALKVHTVWDLGVGNQLAIGFYQRSGSDIKMIDYWQGKNDEGIIHGIKAVQNKPYIYGSHFAPHDINAREESTGKTRKDLASDLGFEFEDVPRVGVNDGIERGKLMFSRLWVSTKCEGWFDAVSQYRQHWDDTRGCFIDKPYHDWTSHPADVHRYASLVEDQMLNEDDFYETVLTHTRDNINSGI